MGTAETIKPGHKAVKQYYESLKAYGTQHVEHEGAVRSAFQNLLAETGKCAGWTLVPELEARAGGRRVRPDGTLRDANGLPRGYWEAKDTHDDLAAEVKKKAEKGYPLSNTIFEDTRRAMLYQDGGLRLAVELKDPGAVAELLNLFYGHKEPNIADFEEAVEAFKERVPELARGLAEKIKEAHGNNAKFQAAYGEFYALCQGALNPNISRGAVDEMLVQHLLTERLMRKIFENEDFTRKNAIAAEIEKVIDALVSRSFSRADYLKSLDRFYVAIEGAARTLGDFAEKQHFLNTVYERFFQGYSMKVADTHGIVYTPQPIVDFMCASVVEVLKEEFGKTLGDAGVNVIDPCTGTGNFIVNLLKRVPRRNLARAYREQFFANEIMLLPYYIAALNIEHTYYELTGQYEPFEGLCFVDTLDMASNWDDFLNLMGQKNTERVNRQKKTPITIVIGNPPYNFRQQNENDNNKNRKYLIIDNHIRDTFSRISRATNKNALSDAYVKFFRWAIDRLENRDGIVCFVTNNSFIDQMAFDGMRKSLYENFSKVYHVDLHGNVRKNPKLSGTIHNVFGIQVGVGITVAIRKSSAPEKTISYNRLPEFWRKEEKLNWLTEHEKLTVVKWDNVIPDKNNDWIRPQNTKEYSTLLCMGHKQAKVSDNSTTIFKIFGCGVKTNRDDVVFDFNRNRLIKKLVRFIDDYNNEVDRYARSGQGSNVDNFVKYDVIKWSMGLKINLARKAYAELSENKVRQAHYRPFCKKYYFFDRVLNEALYQFFHIYPEKSQEAENTILCVSGPGNDIFRCLIAKSIVELKFSNSANGGSQCFPFYVYDEDGTNRRENITDWALEEFRKHYGDRKIAKWDIFYYVYGVLHHAGYREKFAENLKRELPRIPLAGDFGAFVAAGRELARLHLEYETLEPWPLEMVENAKVPFTWRVTDKMRLNKEKTELKVNESLTLRGIPAEAFEYRLGNRSALEWVIDQYQVKEDARSGIRSDPNREDDEEYIVRLAGQVTRVSVETARIVKGLPESVSC